MTGRGGKGGSHKAGAPNIPEGEGYKRVPTAWRAKPTEPLYMVSMPPELGSDAEAINQWRFQELRKMYQAIVANTNHLNVQNCKWAAHVIERIQECMTRKPEELSPEPHQKRISVAEMTDEELETHIQEDAGEGTEG